MKLHEVRALVTGASGGIGAAIAREIVAGGGRVLITGRDVRALQRLALSLDPHGDRVVVHVADIVQARERDALIAVATARCDGVNVLVNNAGVASFGAFAQGPAQDFEHLLAVNVLAPMHLCRALLPHLQRQPAAHIVNVGSVFGAIGYPGQVAYSTSKFALRGFSEALRRELGDSTVNVHYLAPRATRTGFNSAAVDELNAELAVATDPPERVAAAVRRMLETGQPEAVIGWPEKLFVRINSILPRLVDRSLARQLPVIRQRLAPERAAPVSIDPVSGEVS
jgi:short-subunit dehydrogenase